MPEENVRIAERPRRRARVSSPRRPRVAPRLLPRRRRDARTQATRRASASLRAGPCCRRPRRRTRLRGVVPTLDEIERRAPERLALIHFGVVDDVADHLARMREELRRWVARVEGGATEEEFVGASRASSQRGCRETPTSGSAPRRSGSPTVGSSVTGPEASRPRRLGEADDLLLARLAVVRAERLVELPLELAGRLQLLGDVGAADQLALDEDLRDRRPAGERRELLADLRVGKDVDRRDRRAGRAQRLRARAASCRT